jgi:4-amino-4-deoxy-L-arabinose transferase-like glycosyltransferase
MMKSKGQLIFSKLKKNLPRISLGVVFLFILALHLWSLMRFPPPFVDEAWLVSRAWAFAHTGHQFGPLDAGLAEKLDHYWIANQWLITALQAAVLRFFPVPMLLPLRVLSLILGFGLLAANYWAASRLGGKSLAAISTFLLAISVPFFFSAHQARYDILAAALAYSALAIVINDTRGKLWSGLAAGVLIGLAVETHLNSLIFIPAVGFYYLVEYGWKFYRKGCIWGFTAGLAIGIAYYLALHVLPNPQTYLNMYNLAFGTTRQPPILTFNLAVILQGFWDVGNPLFLSSASTLVLAALAVPLLIRKKARGARTILAINAALIVGDALLLRYKLANYAILLTPAFLWMVSAYLDDFIKKPWLGKVGDYAGRIIVGVLVAGFFIFSATFLRTDGSGVFQQTQAKVNAVVLPGETILGPQTYWFGLYRHRYYSWELLIVYSRYFPGSKLSDALGHFRPDIIIIDSHLDSALADGIDPNSMWYPLRLPREEWYSFLADHGTLILDEPTDQNGIVRVYRLNWEK